MDYFLFLYIFLFLVCAIGFYSTFRFGKLFTKKSITQVESWEKDDHQLEDSDQLDDLVNSFGSLSVLTSEEEMENKQLMEQYSNLLQHFDNTLDECSNKLDQQLKVLESLKKNNNG
ncbi:hypothetical protein DICPUDRAFT_74521 [Dictyostelium purpureum]|uniref:Uncharacterized protein n=1 Tax=Dictyostelium purpureum TaxID=5786 RepID=F0Z7Z3_DICPU|nr:uncharacterized protein DICPUDRAFT_74521 [Dictyostelium purpureum]EGC39932.1 hypothetical protein DICPUDRAFT_74521 [Dictyostelium purpureum]|eukprot:XP_003283561.1 hypothetical protein DICPUDRAFT_74521 [Dictyostelium purpureum]